VTFSLLNLFCSRKTLRISAAVLFCFVLVVLPSFPKVRVLLSAPLVVHDPEARGDACYVLSGGGSLRERLDAAADLVQMGRVSKILLTQDARRSQYSFKDRRSWTRGEWSADYLVWRGIAAERIVWLPPAAGFFGTLSEARTVAGNLPKELNTLVLVSSAPHMRRTVLAFRRSLPAMVRVVPYAATGFETSYEMYHPLWIEYLKLLVYYAVS